METQAQKNKRIEATLKKRGAAFKPGEQVKKENAKRAAKQSSVAPQKTAPVKREPVKQAKRSSMPIIDAQIKKAGG